MTLLAHRPAPTQSAPPAQGPATPRRPRRSRPRGAKRPLPVTILFYALLAVVLAIFVVPVYWLFSSAIKPEWEIYTYPLQWIPTTFEWENFVRAWNAVPFDRFFVNSLIVTTVGTTLEISVAVLSAYAFVFVLFRFKTPLFLFMVGSMMLPGHITLLVNYMTMGNLGWINTYQGLILPGIGSAFAMFLLYQQMRQVPSELVDAAMVDGAGHLRRMRSVVLPICTPMLLTCTLIVLIAKWNEFVWPLIITTTSTMRTLPIGLLFLRSEEGYTNWGSIMAGTLMVALPMLLIFFLAQKRIIGGLTSGALKG
ncbi:carbohydrate ABC transporter permease [Pseudactinotalea sp. Z1748]|uniref:carbohydrate ABC transporter permease n=1 Tax=Pseudactinotalea sp. Z1748 TaxID=3413027 RepID=UPI003C7E1896